jgi:predicted DNA-binding transcriptional regulator AlpA
MTRTKQGQDAQNTPKKAPSSSPEQMLRIAEVAETLGISRRTFERIRSAGTFPRHDFRIGRIKLWRSSTVQSWIAGESVRQQREERRVA